MKIKKHHLLTINKLLIEAAVAIGFTLIIWLIYVSVSVANNKVQIGSSYMTMNNEFYPLLNEQVANYVEERKGLLYSRDPALSVNKQVDEIHSLVNKQVNAIILNPVDGKSPKLNKAIAAAHKEGTKIVIVDSPVKTKQVDCTILSDNYKAGQLCAKTLMSKKKEAKILLLTHPTALSAVDRINGFTDTIKKSHNHNYQIVGRISTFGQSEYSYPRVKKFIQNGNKFDTIMALNDRTAVGALAAIDTEHQTGKIKVYSVDGSKDMKKMLGVNKSAQATVAQFPIEMGNLAAKVAYKLIDGKKVPKKIILPVKIITTKNLNYYNTSGWQ